MTDTVDPNLPSPVLGPDFVRAVGRAIELHARQARKGTRIPYASHLLAVASLVLEDGGDQDQAIAALLHDAIEDQNVTPAEIRNEFGDAVARIVEGCTDAYTRPKPPWRERKERFIARLRTAPPEVLRVVAADKLHNARCILQDLRHVGDGLWPRFNAKPEEILWYHRALADVLMDAAPGRLAAELHQVVCDLEREAERTGRRRVPAS